MSNADDNQGRRGLFRRNRSEDPVASTPPADAANPNPEIRTEPGVDADRKQTRRPGLGRRKAAADGSWSSDAWEDGWDDDWSDRSSRAGVRPAADPRPAEVDAWLASSDDQLGDITRDIARKWTGNKQPEPVNAAITWADDVIAQPSRALVNDPFTDDPFVASGTTEATDSFAADDDLWDSPTASSDWTETATDPIDLIDFAADELPVTPVAAPIDLGSTWDDTDPSTPVTPIPPSPQEIFESTPPTEPATLATFTAAVDEVPDPTIEIQPASTPEVAVVPLEPLPAIAEETSPEVAVIPVTTELQEVHASSFPLADAPETPSKMAFDFAGSTENIEPPAEHIAVQDLPDERVDPVTAVFDEGNPSVDTVEPARNPYTPKESEASVSEVPRSEAPEVEGPVVEGPVVEVLEAPVAETPEHVTPAAEIHTADAATTQGSDPEANSAAELVPLVTEEVLAEASSVVKSPVVEMAAEITAPPASQDPIEIDHLAQAVSTDPVVIEQHEIVEPVLAAAQPTASAPIERDEFLDSLYEELDDEDVPAERKVVHHQSTSHLAPTATPIAEPELAATAVAENVEPEPLAGEAAPFARATTNVDRVTESLASPSNEQHSEHLTESVGADAVAQDPNADFDFGPDRPVYAPNVAPIAASAGITPKGATVEAIVEDDDLFPPTKADRFGAALDQLHDDETNPSGLSEPAGKKGFLRGRKSRKDNDVATVPASVASEFGATAGLPVAPLAAVASALNPSADNAKLASQSAVTSNLPGEDFDDQDDLAELDEYDDLDAYTEEAYFSPKLTKLLSRAGFLLVALAALRMFVLVGLAVKDGAKDAQGTQDVFHRIGSAFAELGVAHGLMLIVGIAMAAAPALLGDPYVDDESRSIGATFGIGLIAAIFGVFGGFAAARLALRTNDIADITNPGVSSTTQWAKVAMNLVATAGVSLVAVIAAVRALGGDRQEDLD